MCMVNKMGPDNLFFQLFTGNWIFYHNHPLSNNSTHTSICLNILPICFFLFSLALSLSLTISLSFPLSPTLLVMMRLNVKLVPKVYISLSLPRWKLLDSFVKLKLYNSSGGQIFVPSSTVPNHGICPIFISF